MRLCNALLMPTNVARIRLAMLYPWIVNHPWVLRSSHMCVKPRKSNVSGRFLLVACVLGRTAAKLDQACLSL